jgi:hypothetical protein
MTTLPPSGAGALPSHLYQFIFGLIFRPRKPLVLRKTAMQKLQSDFDQHQGCFPNNQRSFQSFVAVHNSFFRAEREEKNNVESNIESRSRRGHFGNDGSLYHGGPHSAV